MFVSSEVFGQSDYKVKGVQVILVICYQVIGNSIVCSIHETDLFEFQAHLP